MKKLLHAEIPLTRMSDLYNKKMVNNDGIFKTYQLVLRDERVELRADVGEVQVHGRRAVDEATRGRLLVNNHLLRGGLLTNDHRLRGGLLMNDHRLRGGLLMNDHRLRGGLLLNNHLLRCRLLNNNRLRRRLLLNDNGRRALGAKIELELLRRLQREDKSSRS